LSLLVGTARGLATSADHGDTWTVGDHGLAATYAQAVAAGGDG